MANGRVLAVAGLAGVLGAVLVAVVVFGTGDRGEVLTVERVQAEGGVVWVRSEFYDRPRFEGDPLAQGRTVVDSWTMWGPDGRGASYVATHRPEGEWLGWVRWVGGEAEHLPEPSGPIVWPVARGNRVVEGELSCEPGAELVTASAAGSLMCVSDYSRPPTGSSADALRPGWPIDLDVVSVQREERFNSGGGVLSIIHRATLEDGSRVVIGSARTRISTMTVAEWAEMRAEVFGESAGAG